MIFHLNIAGNFFYFSITPKLNIDYFFAKIDIYYSKILFDVDNDKRMINVNSGYKYYLIIKSQVNKTININFIMDIIYNNSFSSVNIYEYNDLFNLYYNKKTNINIKDKIKGNIIEIPISYKVVNTSTNYTFIEFIPEKSIQQLIINLNVTNITNESDKENNENNEDNNNFKLYYIIVPLIIIVAIIIIIFIIILIKRKNKISSDIIENTTQQPLFSNPENN